MTSRRTFVRRYATLLHRYVGLVLALFLAIVGLTGAAIAWNDELERVFAPVLFVLPPGRAQLPALDPFALRDAAARAMPEFAVNAVDFTRRRDQPARFAIEARPGGATPANTEIALDPASGALVGARRQGDLRQGWINLMPFIYDVHDALALGDRGALVLGLVALLWTIDCFVGAYLTLPPVRAKWWAKWRKAWRVRRPATSFKLTFDLHRAGGLWLWGVLLLFSWSSVSFNLPAVYRPIMCTVLACIDDPPQPPARSVPQPVLGWRQAHALAQERMAAIARQQGFTVLSERLMFYDPGTHAYSYRVRSDRDPGRLGNTQIRIDGDDGRVSAVSIPTGRAAGDTITIWLETIHTAGVFGRTLKIVITLTGLMIAGLSVTGVLIFLRKAASRKRGRAKAT